MQRVPRKFNVSDIVSIKQEPGNIGRVVDYRSLSYQDWQYDVATTLGIISYDEYQLAMYERGDNLL